MKDCGGVTYEQGSKKYTLRQGPDLRASPSNEISWIESKLKVNSSFKLKCFCHFVQWMMIKMIYDDDGSN